MIAEEIHKPEKNKFTLSEHPWISLGALWGTEIFVLVLVALAANLIGVPADAPYRPLITPTLAHILVLFILTPSVLHLPNGKRLLRSYLEDIRLSQIQPFLPLLFLGVSSSLILLLSLASNSIVYRMVQGLPINTCFLRRMIDLRADLPPDSHSYIVSFPAIFEEVSWRGVMLVLFLKKYSAKKSILITALGFGVMHFLNLIGGVDPAFVLRQVIFGSALGLFYGYLVLRADSLMPAMLFHYLVNLFIGSFTGYFQRYVPTGTQTLYTLINLTFSVPALILWVRFFCDRWIPRADGLNPVISWRKYK